jgi:ribosomal protein S18 acetylase RimI-like enzyme
VFPSEPERGVYNNALLDRALTGAERTRAVEAMEAAYAAAGVGHFAAWVHEYDPVMRAELEGRGYVLDSSTRAMGMSPDDVRLPRPELELGSIGWCDYLRTFGLPSGLLHDADLTGFHLRVARQNGVPVATALAFDREGDCGIYNVGTLEHARRRGFGTALTAVMVHDAHERGCRTASLQSTEMAERVYAAVGFRDLGRILEYVPARAAATMHP